MGLQISGIYEQASQHIREAAFITYTDKLIDLIQEAVKIGLISEILKVAYPTDPRFERWIVKLAGGEELWWHYYDTAHRDLSMMIKGFKAASFSENSKTINVNGVVYDKRDAAKTDWKDNGFD